MFTFTHQLAMLYQDPGLWDFGEWGDPKIKIKISKFQKTFDEGLFSELSIYYFKII